jgi:MoxR-like ATPase
MQDAQNWVEGVVEAIERVIFGKRDVIERILVALLSGGHVLLEDNPGVGKTILARALSLTLGGTLRRIQCTPDLLPADVLGVSVYNPKSGEFTFKEGPIMANVLLVDEINRATPRTQSALLEAMTDAKVTVEGKTRTLPSPFFMIATQNPVEFEGTFPLPEAQKDRFFLSLSMGYPPEEAEEDIMLAQRRMTHPVSDLTPVTDLETVLTLRREVQKITVPEKVEQAIYSIVKKTREDARLQLGASPRASMALYRGAQAIAAMRGRPEAEIQDVMILAEPVLQKRIAVNGEDVLRGITGSLVIQELLESVAISRQESA